MKSLDARHYFLALRLERECVESFADYLFSLPAVPSLSRRVLHPGSRSTSARTAAATPRSSKRWPSHPILLVFPEARIHSQEADGIRDVRYEETEHYPITRRFLEDPGRMLKHLLE